MTLNAAVNRGSVISLTCHGRGYLSYFSGEGERLSPLLIWGKWLSSFLIRRAGISIFIRGVIISLSYQGSGYLLYLSGERLSHLIFSGSCYLPYLSWGAVIFLACQGQRLSPLLVRGERLSLLLIRESGYFIACQGERLPPLLVRGAVISLTCQGNGSLPCLSGEWLSTLFVRGIVYLPFQGKELLEKIEVAGCP